MIYSDDDIKKFYRQIAAILKFDNRGIVSLEDLKKEGRWKEINFQEKCEGDNSLGSLLLKHAGENNNLHVEDFFLKNGFNLPEQEQVAAVVDEKKGKEQSIPEVEKNKAGGNRVDSSISGDTQLAMSYHKIKEIVINNPDITAGKFNEELKKEKIDTKITNQDGWTLPYYAVRSEGPHITGDRSVFLKTIELLTNLNIGIDFKDTASRTVLDTAAINKQADVIKILLDSGKFNEKEKFNALRFAIIQGNVEEAETFLDYVNAESRQAALELAMNNTQREITQVLLDFITPKMPNVEKNRAKPCSSNGNIGSRFVATAPPINTSGNNNKNETPVSTRTGPTATPNNDNKANGSVDTQFPRPSEKETRYKESKENFHASLRGVAVGVVITGSFIAAAVMLPSLAGVLVCSVLAILVAIGTGLHVKNSTLPSYREMGENKVEHVNPNTQTP